MPEDRIKTAVLGAIVKALLKGGWRYGSFIGRRIMWPTAGRMAARGVKQLGKGRVLSGLFNIGGGATLGMGLLPLFGAPIWGPKAVIRTALGKTKIPAIGSFMG